MTLTIGKRQLDITDINIKYKLAIVIYNIHQRVKIKDFWTDYYVQDRKANDKHSIRKYMKRARNFFTNTFLTKS